MKLNDQKIREMKIEVAAKAAQTWIRSVCDGFGVDESKLPADHPLLMLDDALGKKPTK